MDSRVCASSRMPSASVAVSTRSNIAAAASDKYMEMELLILSEIDVTDYGRQSIYFSLRLRSGRRLCREERLAGLIKSLERKHASNLVRDGIYASSFATHPSVCCTDVCQEWFINSIYKLNHYFLVQMSLDHCN